IPCLIQEQNSYAGLTNKLLAKRVHKICVAYEGMESYFSKDKIVVTGNPVRSDIVNFKNNKEERSEERRVGKECRTRWWQYDEKKEARSQPRKITLLDDKRQKNYKTESERYEALTQSKKIVVRPENEGGGRKRHYDNNTDPSSLPS